MRDTQYVKTYRLPREATITEMVVAFGVERHHVEYAIRSRAIDSVRRVGNVCLYGARAQRAILRALEEMEAAAGSRVELR